MYSILFLAVISFLACLCLTPLVRRWSQRQGFVDRPNAQRKKHAAPTPRTGGLAIGMAYLVALSLLLVSPLNGADAVNLPLALDLLPAAALVFIVGLLDDIQGLRPWQKLLGQVGAGGLAYVGGVQVAGVAGFAAQGWWTLPITIAWLVACSNAFNLIDGMDGLATGVGLFASFTTLAAALLSHNAPLALATAPLVGALLAFLRYNFDPASIFLGDCGSLSIGFLLGCFAAVWSQKSATLVGMTAPLMALAVPLIDTCISVVRRFLRHQPIFTADRNHLHHRLLDRGLSPRRVALVLYGVCGVAAAFSLLATLPKNGFEGLLLVGFCAAVWLGVRLVGYVEFDATRRLVLGGTFRQIVKARLYVTGVEQRMAAAGTPEDYWEVVRGVGREFGCAHMRLSLKGRVFDERGRVADIERCCTVRVPLDDGDYVNLRYPPGFSVGHSVAIGAVVEILQRSLIARSRATVAVGTLHASSRAQLETVSSDTGS